MEKYTCVLEGRNSRLSITYNFSPKIIFRQLWKACQKLWKVLTIFILCFKLDSTKISDFNNKKCKSTREKSDETSDETSDTTLDAQLFGVVRQ